MFSKTLFSFSLLLTVVLSAADPCFQFADGVIPEKSSNVTAVTENNMKFLRFSGNDSFFIVPKPAKYKSFTVSMYIRPKVLNGGTVYATTGANAQRLFLAPDGVLQMQMWEKGQLLTKWAGRIKKDVWVHLQISYDAVRKTASIYVNGKRTMRYHFTAGLAPLRGDMSFGRMQSGKNRICFNGDMNHIKIYTDVVSQEELQKQLQTDSALYPGLYVPEKTAILPLVAAGTYTPEELAQFKKQFPERLAGIKNKFVPLKKELEDIFRDTDCLQKKRIFKRFEIFSRLEEFTAECIKMDTADGYCMAKQSLLDMEELLRYFNEEKNAFSTFPVEGKNATVFHLKDFGAKGDGAADDSPAFAKALEAVQKLNGKPAILKIPAGTFLLKTPLTFSYDDIPGYKNLHDQKSFSRGHLALGGLKNVTLQGEGPEKTKLLFGIYNLPGITLGACYNTTVAGLEVRWQEPLFSVGKIIAKHDQEKAYTIEHIPGTMRPDDPRLNGKSTYGSCPIFDENHKIQKVGLILSGHKTQNLGNGKFKFFTNKRFYSKLVKPGQYISIPDRNNWYGAFELHNGSLCNLENVVIRNSRAAAIRAVTRYPSYYRVKIKPLDGMFMSTNADGCISAVGTFACENDFTGMTDDAYNLSGHGFFLEQQDGNQLYLNTLTRVLKAGDPIFAVNPENGQIIGNTVAAGESIARNARRTLHQLAVTQPLRNAVSNAMLKQNRGMAGSLGSPISGVYRKGTLATMCFADRSHSGTATVVMDCKIDNSSSSGIVVQAGPALIENNTVDNVCWQSVRVGALLMCHEGPAPYCVTIRNNHFLTPHYGLVTSYSIKNRKLAPTAGIWGLLYENNRIVSPKRSMEIANLANSIFRHNQIDSKDYIFSFQTCENIIFDKNKCGNAPIEKEDLILKNSRNFTIK